MDSYSETVQIAVVEWVSLILFRFRCAAQHVSQQHCKRHRAGVLRSHQGAAPHSSSARRRAAVPHDVSGVRRLHHHQYRVAGRRRQDAHHELERRYLLERPQLRQEYATERGAGRFL